MTALRLPLLALAVLAASASLSAQQKDNFGDPLPAGAKARVGTTRMTRTGGGAEWMGATLTPDGKHLFAAVHAGAIEKIDVTAGRRAGTVGEEITNRDSREVLRLSADGKRGLRVVGKEVVVWDVETGREINRFAGYGGSLSADGKLIAFGDVAPPSIEKGPRDNPMGGPPEGAKNEKVKAERDGALTVVVWDVDKKEKRREIAVAETEGVLAFLSPDGKTLATWGVMRQRRGGDSPYPAPPADTPVQFWDVATGKALGRVTLKKSVPSAVVFSPDSTTVAIGNWGGTVLLVDPQTGGVQPILADAGEVTLLAFAPDGKTLASGDFAGTVRFWNTAKAKEISSTKAPAKCGVMQIVFTDAEKAVAWGVEGSKAVVWEVPSGKLLSPYGGHSNIVSSFAFTPDGKELLSSGEDGTEWALLRWDPATGKPLGKRVFEAPKNTNLPDWRSVRPFPDGTRVLASAGVVRYIYDIKTGTRLPALGLAGYGNSAHVSTGGELLITPIGVKSSERPDPTRPLKHSVKNLLTGKEVCEIELPTPGLQQATRTADGKQLVTLVYRPFPGEARSEVVLTLWELATGKKLGELKDAGQSLMFAPGPDGKTALVADALGRLRSVDLTTGKTVYDVDTGGLAPFVAPVFGPDGKVFAVGLFDRTKNFGEPHEVRVYDAETGKALKTFRGHDGFVSGLAFSPDGKTLASGSYDTTVLLWDLSAIEKK